MGDNTGFECVLLMSTHFRMNLLKGSSSLSAYACIYNIHNTLFAYELMMCSKGYKQHLKLSTNIHFMHSQTLIHKLGHQQEHLMYSQPSLYFFLCLMLGMESCLSSMRTQKNGLNFIGVEVIRAISGPNPLLIQTRLFL